MPGGDCYRRLDGFSVNGAEEESIRSRVDGEANPIEDAEIADEAGLWPVRRDEHNGVDIERFADLGNEPESMYMEVTSDHPMGRPNRPLADRFCQIAADRLGKLALQDAVMSACVE